MGSHDVIIVVMFLSARPYLRRRRLRTNPRLLAVANAAVVQGGLSATASADEHPDLLPRAHEIIANGQIATIHPDMHSLTPKREDFADTNEWMLAIQLHTEFFIRSSSQELLNRSGRGNLRA